MSYHLLGHSSKLGSALTTAVWNLLLDDPSRVDQPSGEIRKSEEFKDCWEFVLDSLARGESYIDSCDFDLEYLWDSIDHDELKEYLTVGLVTKLELVEHGYFSATLEESPVHEVKFRFTSQDHHVRQLRRGQLQSLSLRSHPRRSDRGGTGLRC